MMNEYRARRLRWMPAMVLAIVVMIGANVAQAQTPIDSVTWDGEGSGLIDLTIDNVLYPSGELFAGISGGDTPELDDFSMDTGPTAFLETDYIPLGTFPAGGLADTNGNLFDIFIFESGTGSATNPDEIPDVFATYSIGGGPQTNGQSITVAGGVSGGDWGQVGTGNTQFNGQDSYGVAFRITDLLDEYGDPLPSQAIIHRFTALDTSDNVDLFVSIAHMITENLPGPCPVTVTHSDGDSQVSEAGETTDSFTVALSEQPGGDVTVTLDPQSGDIGLNGQAVNTPLDLSFDADNWDTPQTVTVKANDDDQPEDTELAHISIDLIRLDLSGDIACSSITSVTVIDNDVPGVEVVQSDESTDVSEEGETTDSFTVALALPPTSTVTITIDPRDEPNQVTLNSGAEGEIVTLTFNTGETAAQTITVKAIDDSDPEGHPHTTGLDITVSQPAGDQAYDGLGVNNVVVSIGENDCGAGPFNAMDYNEDCMTNLLDFAIFAANLGGCSITSVDLCP